MFYSDKSQIQQVNIFQTIFKYGPEQSTKTSWIEYVLYVIMLPYLRKAS